VNGETASLCRTQGLQPGEQLPKRRKIELPNSKEENDFTIKKASCGEIIPHLTSPPA